MEKALSVHKFLSHIQDINKQTKQEQKNENPDKHEWPFSCRWVHKVTSLEKLTRKVDTDPAGRGRVRWYEKHWFQKYCVYYEISPDSKGKFCL